MSQATGCGDEASISLACADARPAEAVSLNLSSQVRELSGESAIPDWGLTRTSGGPRGEGSKAVHLGPPPLSERQHSPCSEWTYRVRSPTRSLLSLQAAPTVCATRESYSALHAITRSSAATCAPSPRTEAAVDRARAATSGWRACLRALVSDAVVGVPGACAMPIPRSWTRWAQ